jgi:division protein 1
VKLQEEELELDDECSHSKGPAVISLLMYIIVEGVKERIEFEDQNWSQKVAPQPVHTARSSRRRKGLAYSSMSSVLVTNLLSQGPAFLPSEHDELPPGVAFMVRYYVLRFSV